MKKIIIISVCLFLISFTFAEEIIQLAKRPVEDTPELSPEEKKILDNNNFYPRYNTFKEDGTRYIELEKHNDNEEVKWNVKLRCPLLNKTIKEADERCLRKLISRYNATKEKVYIDEVNI